MRILAILLAFAATPAWAGDVIVTVTTPDGKPVRDAVVTLQPKGRGPETPPPFAWPLSVDQKAMQFEPFVLVVPKGGEVAFPNRDAVQHHVYSFSPAKKFELKLYGRDESRRVRFDTAGVVALGCNIHDSMLAFLKVVDTRWAAKTEAAGTATLKGAPGGAATMRVWHPYLRAPGNEIATAVVLPRDGVSQHRLVVTMRASPGQHVHSY